jgi:hypothetical protein
MFADADNDLLQAAIEDFADICVQDLTDYDDELQQFNVTLTRKEQSILALSMIVHWLEPYVYILRRFEERYEHQGLFFLLPC